MKSGETVIGNDAIGTMVDVGGTRLWVEKSGEGPAVLLLAGLGYASWTWRDLRAALSPRWTVVSVDNRGAGRSEKPEGPYSIEQMADDAARALWTLGISSAHVLGHSMGGYIALTLARRHPQLVRSLALVATSAGGPGTVPVPKATLEAWKTASVLSPAEFARRTMPLSFAPGWAVSHAERFEALLASRLEFPTPADCWRAQYAACERFLVEGGEAARLPVRTLVIHGQEDRIVPSENGMRLKARLLHGRVALVPGAGHNLHLEMPEAFAKMVEEHFAEEVR